MSSHYNFNYVDDITPQLWKEYVNYANKKQENKYILSFYYFKYQECRKNFEKRMMQKCGQWNTLSIDKNCMGTSVYFLLSIFLLEIFEINKFFNIILLGTH